jgi:mRNA-degrading endonuclease YafQ of YafQ-DinJ toxin-antitoxin module
MDPKRITFSEFLREAQRGFHRPNFTASPFFKAAVERLDPATREVVLSALRDFKDAKTFDPSAMASGRFNDHQLHGQLSKYYDCHLIHGHLVLIYYHGGEYIILMDLLPHSAVETKRAPDTSRRLDAILPKMQELAVRNLQRAKVGLKRV